jgi:molecular chaperone DnaK
MTGFVGIDLGTTYSAVAYTNAQGKPEIIPNERGRSITPSVIYFGTGMPIVGDEAKERQAAGETEIASFFKRSMDDTQYLLSFHGQDYTPVDLSALVLRYLKQQAELFLEMSVTHSVITVPAYFTHVQRSAVIEAGRNAGLQVLKIISEPTAAALAYGLRPSRGEQRVLVYDLGGGTFDVSLVSIDTSDLRVIATSGDHNLGGKDWDDRLISHLAHEFENEFGIELIGDDVNELRVKAENLKFALSARKTAEIGVHADGKIGTYTVSRELFEDLTRDLMERTQLLTEQVLSEAELTWLELSGVLPVGGSTRMPMVRNYIERMSGKPPMGGINPDEAVALGAAIQATLEMELLPGGDKKIYPLLGRKATIDATAHSLGMIAENADRSAYVNSIIIRKNQPISSSQTRPYQQRVRFRGDSTLEVFLTQGESDNPQHCTYLGRYVFSDFPILNTKLALLDITYHYDKNGVVNISAVERSSGKPLTLTVEPVPADVPSRFAGCPVEIQQTREHLGVYLAFDLSGSMAGNPLAEAQKAAGAFVRQCDLSNTSIGLISFSDSVHVDLKATQNGKDIFQAIKKLAIGRTGYGNDGHPFDQIYRSLEKVAGLRYAIVLADGVWYDQPLAIQRAKRCHQIGIEVVAIGFGGADRKFLQQIASSTEQCIYTDMNRLTETFSTIAQELTESSGEKPHLGKLRSRKS